MLNAGRVEKDRQPVDNHLKLMSRRAAFLNLGVFSFDVHCCSLIHSHGQ